MLSAVLCEYKLLFICKNMRRLSALVLALLSILEPLKYPFPVVPILPDGLVHLLSSPLPLLAGMTSKDPLKNKDIPTDLIILDIEEPLISEIPSKPSLPELPNYQKLIDTLSYFYPIIRNS
uniref:UDENN domain-containing protein n=1 Tax=Arcella intermedia TaxID=1963864 RepID=A0A6B2LRF6_9EUKA